MRTAVTIPDDVLAAARQRAEGTGHTTGEALADLERLEAGQAPGDSWNGVKLLPRRPGQPSRQAMRRRVGMAVPHSAVPGTLDARLVTNAVIRGVDHLQVIP